MTPEADLTRVSRLLLRTTSRVESDRAARQRRIDTGSLTRVLRGTYVTTPVWRSLDEKDQHLAKLIATHEAAHTPPVFSHLTAAVLHKLPLYGALPRAVHTIGAAASTEAQAPGVVRDRMMLAPEDTVEIAGVRCTSIERTLADLAVTAPPEVSLSAIDGYLRREFRVKRLVDWGRLVEWQADMQARLSVLSGARGIRQARLVFALADPRKDSVLESISHLQLHRLGFEVALQVPVPSPTGRDYHIDFEFVGLQLFGECDGKEKYVNALLRAGLSADEIVYREKRRHNWICGTTKKDLIHWGYPDAVTPLALARRLQAFGVVIPRMPK